MRKPRLLLPEAVSQGKHSIGAVILLATVLFANSGCAGLGSDEMSGGDAATQLQASVEAKESGADLHVFIDWSGSCVRPALDEAWATVKSELPAIVEKHRIGALTIWSFDTDGWCPKRIASVELPVFTMGEHPKLDGGEWESFSNIQDAVRKAETQEWEKRQGAATERSRHKLQEALAHMDSVSALADSKYETPRSDPVGLLERIAATHDQRAQYFIVLTDMADTQRKVFPKLDQAKSEVHALVLVVPAKRSDALLTLGKALSGPEQFEARSRQLRESAPWITVAPYFARDLAKLLSNREEPPR